MVREIDIEESSLNPTGVKMVQRRLSTLSELPKTLSPAGSGETVLNSSAWGEMGTVIGTGPRTSEAEGYELVMSARWGRSSDLSQTSAPSHGSGDRY